MDLLKDFTKLLPKYEEIEKAIEGDISACYILKGAIKNMNEMQQADGINANSDGGDERYLISALVDQNWERIHTGHFSEVPIEIRKIYALASIFKIFYVLFDGQINVEQLEKCSEILDKAQLIGCTNDLYPDCDILIATLMDYFNNRLEKHNNLCLPIIAPLKRQLKISDIPQYDCPDVSDFNEKCFKSLKPALLLKTIQHWPALNKWNDLNYIMRIAGNRTVPIEIGANYATDEWSQQMVKIRDFLGRQFGTNPKTTEIEYLAQHELFDQIPALKADICVPDYCVLGEQCDQIDIKAWLGPKGTVSPMHYDPKHNLLCQVFGIKHIILAAPEDSENLYPHEGQFLSNTSQLNAADLDLNLFPRAANVKFYNVLLQAGDCLYIPPKWWHYVRSEAPSFSVSFWWE